MNNHLGWPYLFWLGDLYGLIFSVISFWSREELAEIKADQDDRKQGEYPENSQVTSNMDNNDNYRRESMEQFEMEKVSVSEANVPSTPWFKILTNRVFLVALIFRIGHASVGMFNINFLPRILKQLFNISDEVNGIFNASLSAINSLSVIGVAYISDKVVQKKYMTLTNTRKIFGAIDGFGRAFFLVLIPISAQYGTLALVFFIIIMANIIATFVSASENPLPAEISLNYGHLIFTINNIVGMFMGVVVPTAVSLLFDLIGDHPSSWFLVYYIAAGVMILSVIPFLIWGSAERQPFDYPENNQ